MVVRTACIVLTLTAACGDDGGASPDGGGCPRSWTVTPLTSGATATIANGQLELRSPAFAPGGGIELTQEGLADELDIAFQVSSFTSGGTGAYVRASLVAATKTFWVQFRDSTLESRIEPDGVGTMDPVTTAGPIRFHFSRTGNKMAAVVTSGDDEAGITEFIFTESPFTVKLSLGAQDGSPTAETAAVIDGFEVTQGNLAADPFDCDSLVR